MSESEKEIFEKVRKCIAEALSLEEEQINPNATLMDELGAESIDLLDILFRIESTFSIKIERGDIEKKARGDLPEAEFVQGGVLTEKGLERVKQLLPEVDHSKLVPGFKLDDIPKLFNTMTFVNVVKESLEKKMLLSGEKTGIL